MYAEPAFRPPRCLACRSEVYRRSPPATRWWSTWELGLLRREDLSTREIQRRTGRTVLGIRLKRRLVCGASFIRRAWTLDEDAAVLRCDQRDEDLSREIGRSPGAIPDAAHESEALVTIPGATECHSWSGETLWRATVSGDRELLFSSPSFRGAPQIQPLALRTKASSSRRVGRNRPRGLPRVTIGAGR